MLLRMSRCALDEGGREVLRIRNPRVKSEGDGDTPASLLIVQRNHSAWCVEQVLGNNSDSAEPDACSESSDEWYGTHPHIGLNAEKVGEPETGCPVSAPRLALTKPPTNSNTGSGDHVRVLLTFTVTELYSWALRAGEIIAD
ncbi:hypothetical protein DFH09DRAFT_1110888 [Mycena vulgaris]|nr:hypothetical protein DFH09DRAFT_1110888 [Mycena vulgaris]